MLDAFEETVYRKGMSLEIKIYLYHVNWWKSMYYRVAAVLRNCKLAGSWKR